MKSLIWMVLFVPLFLNAQDHGVFFQQNLSWKEILQKAKAENKYIFVDCYATWCGPCKMMDKNTYPNDTVGRFLNAHFVSVKVQMDTSKKDEPFTQSWYADAHRIMKDYKVTAYPSFLFLSPDGSLVHRGLGYQPTTYFLALAKDATEPGKQYYTLVGAYKEGKKDYALMPSLAQSAKKFNDPELSTAIASDYLHNYLDKLPLEAICTEENLGFLANFVDFVRSKDKVFELYYKHPEMPDSILHDKSYGERYVDYIITKEEIAPLLVKSKNDGTQPEWTNISGSIKNKFGAAYAERNVVAAKMRWYEAAKDWANYTKYLTLNMKLTGIRNIPGNLTGIVVLNNCAYEIFLHSNVREELEAALSWSDRSIEISPKPTGGLFDTRANLLYKLGKKEEAIAVEIKAHELDPQAKDIAECLEKMRHDEPTWIKK